MLLLNKKLFFLAKKELHIFDGRMQSNLLGDSNAFMKIWQIIFKI
uniref:Uncharacterized protein n=1 Tax=Arundo donax TaxID=35708 RepID=A0A0A8YEP0_ARUDO